MPQIRVPLTRTQIRRLHQPACARFAHDPGCARRGQGLLFFAHLPLPLLALALMAVHILHVEFSAVR